MSNNARGHGDDEGDEPVAGSNGTTVAGVGVVEETAGATVEVTSGIVVVVASGVVVVVASGIVVVVTAWGMKRVATQTWVPTSSLYFPLMLQLPADGHAIDCTRA